NGKSVFVWKSRQLLIENGHQITPESIDQCLWVGKCIQFQGPLAIAAPQSCRPYLACGSKADSVQPRTDLIAANGTRLARQDQKRRLKGIVGGVGVGQDTPANTQHHRSMPVNQARKRGLISVDDVGIEKLAVRAIICDRSGYGPAQHV